MFNYPTLSSQEQAGLPALTTKPQLMPTKFSDSTHQLWHCETVDGPMVLKVCQQTSIAKSSFWQGMNHLFGIAFPQHLGQTTATANHLKDHGTFAIPQVVSAMDNRYVLTAYINGTDVESTAITKNYIQQLAKHIAQLHSKPFHTWGNLHAPQFSPAQWSQRLHSTLSELAHQSDLIIPKALLDAALAQALTITETTFVPIMPDLRWDQLRQSGDDLTLLDLDAFVIGPRSLELVIIMNLLTPTQLQIFKQTYCQQHDWPDLTHQAQCYQLLLFMMHILGETDCEAWMQRIPAH